MKSWSCIIALVFVCSLGLLIGSGTAEARITAVSADVGGCGMALNDNGTVWIWGSVYSNVYTGLQPIIIPGVNNVTAMTGYLDPVVLNGNGSVWVLENYGIKQNTSQPNMTDYYKGPVEINGLSDIFAISGTKAGFSGEDLLALKYGGTVWAMGENTYGQLGTESGMGQPSGFLSYNPVQVNGLSNITAISMGMGHAMALKNDGTVWSWGLNNMGQLGNGTANQQPNGNDNGQSTPVMATGLTNVTAISAGDEFSMALGSNGTVWTWGGNDFGELGDGVPGNVEDYSAVPVQVKGLTNVTAISAGENFALALRSDGTVWAWGDNRFDGMLGNGTLENSNVPVQVNGLSGIVTISAGATTCYALDESGDVWAWGDDSTGQLQDGNFGPNVYRPTAEQVPFTEALSGPAIKPSWMTSSAPQMEISAPVVQNNPIQYMSFVNGTIYSFTSNGLTAMNDKGVAMWNLSIAGNWTYDSAYNLITDPHAETTVTSYVNGTLSTQTNYNSVMATMVKTVPIFAADDGYVYLYALSNASDASYQPMEGRTYLNQTSRPVGKDLIAVSPNGTVEWTRQFTDDVAIQDNSHVEALDGRIYLYHDYNETVLDSSGNVLFTIENISNPVSVDEDGNIYAVQATSDTSEWLSTPVDGVYFDYRTPSNVVEAFTPDGKLNWTKELDENVAYSYFYPAIWNGNIGIPLYDNGLIYVPQENGTVALNKDGSVNWTKDFGTDYQPFYLMPMDSQGNLYLYHRDNDGSQDILVVSPNGTVISSANVGSTFITSASEGLLFEGNEPISETGMNVSPDNLEKGWISAYDLLNGQYAWNFTTPIGQPTTVTVNESNVLTLFPDAATIGIAPGTVEYGNSSALVIPAGNITYIYFRTSALENPNGTNQVVYGQSTCTYYSALYAIDRSGKLVLQKPMNGFMTAAAVNNSTIYYSTTGGGISVTTAAVAAAGIVLIGIALVAAKFLLFGNVSRARSRLDKNDNRNLVYRFITSRPGSTLHEMAKEMRMNIGTLRYHLMILGLNHRITAYNDGKFVRYFTNSNSYSNEDKMIISLTRRESMGKLLKTILDNGEMTNGELCTRLGLPESSISKYMGELSDKGVVTKTGQGKHTYYSIRELHRDRLSKAFSLMDDREANVKTEGKPADKAGTYM